MLGSQIQFPSTTGPEHDMPQDAGALLTLTHESATAALGIATAANATRPTTKVFNRIYSLPSPKESRYPALNPAPIELKKQVDAGSTTDSRRQKTAHLRKTSSVASGRAKKRKGTNVVPSPGETCIVVAPRR